MTKSGVGTTATTTTSNNNNNNNNNSMNGQSSSSSTTQITSPEIPIWVSDRKKWVTGISKKTTINDIIYAILKQCHINCEYEYINDYVLVEIMYSLTNDQQHQQNINDSQQQQNFIINSERVLKGNSKVYKYLSKWLENSNKLILKVKKCEIIQVSDDNNGSSVNLNVSLSSASSLTNHDNHNTSLDTTITGVNHSNNSNTNTITKFFKKLTNVNSNNTNNFNNNNNSNNTNNSNNNNTNKINLNNSSKQIIRYVDVKLTHQPQTQHQQQHQFIQAQQQQQQQQQQQHQQQLQLTPPIIPQSTSQMINQSTLTRINKAGIVPIASLQQQQQQQHHHQQYQQIINEYELDYDQPIINQKTNNNELPLPFKQYDPTLQKTLIVSNILDKDKKLNQQFERVKLLDELIKEAEKTLIINENYYLSNQQFLEDQSQQIPKISQQVVKQPLQQQQQQQQQQHTIDLNLNDIYSCFPEMYTHGSNEVEEFQLMCSKLLNLDDNVHQQKQLLNKLEFDIQKELTMNNSQYNQQQNENLDDLLQISSTLIETPETVKLKKEVNLSREQTRIQCKELHDLDLRMRQNETLLTHKENELKNLLEELYLHEIYLDTVNNSSITDTNNLPTTALSYIHKTATLTSSSSATNSKLKTLTGTNSINNTNNALSSSSTSTASSSKSSSSSASLTPPIEHLINKSSISSINTIVPQHQQQQQQHTQQISPLPPMSQPPPLPTSLPPPTTTVNNVKTNDHCDNDSGISSMSSENDANLMHHHNSKLPYIQLQQPVKSVMETLV